MALFPAMLIEQVRPFTDPVGDNWYNYFQIELNATRLWT